MASCARGFAKTGGVNSVIFVFLAFRALFEMEGVGQSIKHSSSKATEIHYKSMTNVLPFVIKCNLTLGDIRMKSQPEKLNFYNVLPVVVSFVVLSGCQTQSNIQKPKPAVEKTQIAKPQSKAKRQPTKTTAYSLKVIGEDIENNTHHIVQYANSPQTHHIALQHGTRVAELWSKYGHDIKESKDKQDKDRILQTVETAFYHIAKIKEHNYNTFRMPPHGASNYEEKLRELWRVFAIIRLQYGEMRSVYSGTKTIGSKTLERLYHKALFTERFCTNMAQQKQSAPPRFIIPRTMELTLSLCEGMIYNDYQDVMFMADEFKLKKHYWKALLAPKLAKYR